MESNTPSSSQPNAMSRAMRWMCGCNLPAASFGPLPLRIIAGLVFMLHGYGKLFATPGIDGFTNFLTSLNVVAPGMFAWIVGLVEFVGGIAILIGCATPLFAALLSVNMVVAWYLTKSAHGVIVGGILNGELELALLAAMLSLVLTGAGRWAVDGKRCLVHRWGK